MNEIAKPAPRTVIPAEQIQKRVREMGRQISDDYRGSPSTCSRCWRMASFSWRTWCGRWRFQ